MSDGLSVKLFDRNGRQCGSGLDVICIRVDVPLMGQAVEGPILMEIVGGKLVVLSADRAIRPWEVDLPSMDGRFAVDWTAERGATMTRGKGAIGS